MRPAITFAAFAISFLTSSVHADPYEAAVDGWYHKYVGHHAPHHVSHELARQLRYGVPAINVQATILASQDYYGHHGNNDWGFVKGLFHDVLGRPGRHNEVMYWMGRLQQVGSRHRLAVMFLEQGPGGRVISSYTPVPVQTYPVVPVMPLPTVRPVVPVYPTTPGVSFSLNFSR